MGKSVLHFPTIRYNASFIKRLKMVIKAFILMFSVIIMSEITCGNNSKLVRIPGNIMELEEYEELEEALENGSVDLSDYLHSDGSDQLIFSQEDGYILKSAGRTLSVAFDDDHYPQLTSITSSPELLVDFLMRGGRFKVRKTRHEAILSTNVLLI